MRIESQKGKIKRRSVLKKIKAAGKMDKAWGLTVHRATATLECKGFKSLIALWTSNSLNYE